MHANYGFVQDARGKWEIQRLPDAPAESGATAPADDTQADLFAAPEEARPLIRLVLATQEAEPASEVAPLAPLVLEGPIRPAEPVLERTQPPKRRRGRPRAER